MWNVPKNMELKKFVDDIADVRTRRRSDNCKYLPGLKLSEFNPQLAKMLYSYYGRDAKNVLDPFAGRATRGLIANMMGKHYIGYDVSPSTIEFAENRFKYHKFSDYELYPKSSHAMDEVADDSVDYIMTCPPYYDLEKYEHTDMQMSDCETYDDFLSIYGKIIRECYKKLREGGLFTIVVAYWRRGRVYDLPYDTKRIAIDSGFLLHDEVISVLNSPFNYCQIGKCDEHSYTSKTHEYILTFSKGNVKKRTYKCDNRNRLEEFF